MDNTWPILVTDIYKQKMIKMISSKRSAGDFTLHILTEIDRIQIKQKCSEQKYVALFRQF